MTITKTADVEGTLAQIYALAAAGADIVRCTCNEEEAAEGLAHIVPRSPVPIIADIHFHHEMALAALEAGVQGLRLNPGNLRKEAEIKQVAQEAKDRGVPIRIGVNAGSLHPELYKRFGGATPEALVESARMELAYFAEVGFDDVKISVKASYGPAHDRGVPPGVGDLRPPAAPGRDRGGASARRARQGHGRDRHPVGRGHRRHHPLLTHRRSGRRGPGRASAARGAGAARAQGLDLIACPSCGRAEIDVIGVAARPRKRSSRGNLPIQVAVMGCVVNGPGEAREADLGIAAGRHRGHLFIKGKIIRVVPEDEMVAALVEEAEKLVAEGVEARLAAADAGAEAEAEADRRMLSRPRGTTPTTARQRVELIRKTIDDEHDPRRRHARHRVSRRGRPRPAARRRRRFAGASRRPSSAAAPTRRRG